MQTNSSLSLKPGGEKSYQFTRSIIASGNMRVARYILSLAVIFLVGCSSPIPPAERTPTPQPATSATSPKFGSHLPRDGVEIVLDCSRGAVFTQCNDSLLRIRFEYPTAWGTLKTNLSSGDAGYEYEYNVSLPGSDNFSRIAGGISGDFTEGREGTVFDYKGWEIECNDYDYCLPIRPGVVVYIVPTITDFCEAGKTIYSWPPDFVVAIQLPQNEAIHGFAFVHGFISETTGAKLDNLIGLPDGDLFPQSCTASNKQAYRSILQDIMSGKQTDFVDRQSVLMVQELMHLAESIEFK